MRLLDQPDAEEAVAKTEVSTFRAIAPGKVTPYFGYIRNGSPNAIPVRSHPELVPGNP